MPSVPATPTLQALVDTATAELTARTAAHQSWGLGSFERWDLDQEQGVLRFSGPDGRIAEAPAQIAGSFNAANGSWLWAWNNRSIIPELRRSAERVRQFGSERGYEPLTSPRLSVSEEEAWELAALTMHLTKAEGVYRGPASDNLFVFIVFGEVRLGQP
ncbi:MAG: DUF6882 domain-containing protein [Myxococcota bacterium]